MTLFWRGKLDGATIFESFLKKADDRLRASAIEFVGRSLRDTKDEVPQNIISRLQTFWLSRLNIAKSEQELLRPR